MEIKESMWVSKAIKNIGKFLNRGGDMNGDKPQLLGGSRLLNTIGVAMGFSVWDPEKWSEHEMQKALNGELVYFVGNERKAIDVIADQIKYCCNGDDKNFVTVLPIELYFDGKLYELPLFRVHRYKDSKKYYVDHVGRSYSEESDWRLYNKLPPGKVIYPHNLTLKLKPGHNYAYVVITDTPSASIETAIMKGGDIVATLAGVGSSAALLFVSGGLAAPLIATGLVSAMWGTTRTGTQLADKALHGESVNPFSSSENRNLWFGIAANIASFGVVGASMRLTSLASRGSNISSSFKILVNVMNSTSFFVSGIAMVDTTMQVIEHYDKLSPFEVLMHVVSIAFWSKGVFTYKTAKTLIKDAQDHTFAVISRELQPQDARNLAFARNQLNNDGQFIKEFRRAKEVNISVETFSQIVFDSTSTQKNIQFDGAGNLILEGQRYSYEILSRLPQNVRRHYFDVITNLRTDQVALLESFRRRMNNDMNLVSGLYNVAMRYQVTPRQATERVLHFWENYCRMNAPTAPNISIVEGRVVLGRAPPLQLNQLSDLSNPILRFIGMHLVPMNETISRQWATSIPLLLQLQDHGMFSRCHVTTIVPTGRAVVLLNKQLQISIHKLQDMDPRDCSDILTLIGQLPRAMASTDIPRGTRQLTNKYRLRLECDRTESVNWIIQNANRHLFSLLGSTLKSFEKDRIFTFRNSVITAKAMPYMSKMMNYISRMNPRNVSQIVSHGEYVITTVEEKKRNLDGDLKSGKLKLPNNISKAVFLRAKASEAVFDNEDAMRRKWVDTLSIVRQNSMVGPASLNSGLSDNELVRAIRGTRIGFGSDESAAYHVLKHPTEPLSAYVNRANETIRSATRWQATLTQDGDARTLRFEGPGGSAVLLERDGSVLLCTFSPKTS